VRHKGYLDGFELSRKDAEDMILSARVQAGWITAEEAGVQAEVEEDGETADAEKRAKSPSSQA